MSAETAFHNLSIIAVQFATLSALFGVYFVLFVIAVWSTCRRTAYTTQKRLRVVTVGLFCVLCIHFISRALLFARARRMNPSPDEEKEWTLPMGFICSITGTIAACLADGLVAWRCYVLYDRRRQALYLVLAVVVVDALLGLAGDFEHLSIYRSLDLFNNRMHMVVLDVKAAWGWCTFTINTVLTASIAGRIVYMARTTSSQKVPGMYSTALEAIIESALVTWIGLLLYEITSFAPTGHPTADLNIGYVMVCITPIYFGISQCLITARLGFAAAEHEDTVTVHSSSAETDSHTRVFRHKVDVESLGDMEFRVPPALGDASDRLSTVSIPDGGAIMRPGSR